MLKSICLCLALLTATPLLCQVEWIPYETDPTPTDEGRMVAPPLVNGEVYPTMVGSEAARSNYLTAGLFLSIAYDDNVVSGSSSTPVHDTIYSLYPAIALDKTTPRQHLTLNYSPGFTLYRHTSALNAADQTAAMTFQYRLSQHTTLLLSDSFQRSSNIFNQLYPVSEWTISNSAQSSSTAIVAPYTGRLDNIANAGISYQVSRNTMIGASGVAEEIRYSTNIANSDFYNSNSRGGSLFYSRRLSNNKYVGIAYQYAISHANPVNAQANPGSIQSDLETQSVFPFFTMSIRPTLSFSLSCGPEYFNGTSSSSFHSWTPYAMASIRWQRSHTNLTANYSRVISGSTGLQGAFASDNASASWSWQITRLWSVSSAADYFVNENVIPSHSGGHTISGDVSVQYSFTEQLKVAVGYTRVHQSYTSIAVISNAPDSNREVISIFYQQRRPLGR